MSPLIADAATAPVDVNSFASVATIVCLAAFGSAILLEAPVLVGAMITQLGFSEAQAGYAMSADLGGMGLASLPALWWVRAVNWRVVALSAFGCMIVGNISTVFVDSFDLFMVIRLLTGTAAGTCMVLCITSIALMKDPDRVFGYMVVGNLVFQTIALAVLPRVIPLLGLGFAYASIAAAMIGFVFLVRYLPAHGKPSVQARDGIAQTNPVVLWAVLGLIAISMYYIGVTGVWAYLERIGDAAGFPATRVGDALAISSFTGLLGAALAAAVAAKFGRTLPVLTGHLLTIAGIGLLTGSLSYPSYLIAICVYNFAWNFLLPYLLACIAAVDVTGRLIASTNGFIGVGLAAGPAVVGTFYVAGNYDRVLWICAACVAASLILMLRLSLPRSAAIDH